MSGVTADGVVVGYQDGRFGGTPDGRLRLWYPDGHQEVVTAPEGWETLASRRVSGDWVLGRVAKAGDDENTPPARWNLRTGQVTVYTGPTLQRTGLLSVSATGRVAVGGRSLGSPGRRRVGEGTSPPPTARRC